MHSPCCNVTLGSFRSPNQQHADRTCYLCAKVWRITVVDGEYVYGAVTGVDRTRPDAVRPIQHGTRHAYDKYKCRCDACRAEKRRYNAARYGEDAPRAGGGKPWSKGGHWAVNQKAYQTTWQYARKHSFTWAEYQEGCKAVLSAIATWGRTHKPTAPPVDMAKVRLLARRERRVLYVKANRVFTTQPIRGPYVEVYPSGNLGFVGGAEGHGRAA